MTPDHVSRAGYQAGQELFRLHLLPAPNDRVSWSDRKREKHARYCSAFTKDPCNPGYDLRPVHEFIGKNLHLMDAVEETFLHDDFHPANLIFSEGSLTGIIDFGRYEWGDPIHDFCKMAFFTREVSTVFACGQVAGYFFGKVPPGFWQRYALYTAMSMISDLVWSARYERISGKKGELHKAMIRTRQVYEDHDGFQNVVPTWYEEGTP
jgi:aminoglycoside phosphotransferase (APT) family kinase protein